MHLPTIIFFPGLGSDGRVYGPQRGQRWTQATPSWIVPESNRETLVHYAERFADQLGPQPGAFVGGISLGAVMALEVAPRVQAAGVIAIGGCTSHKQIAPFFRGLLKAGATVPSYVARFSLLASPLALKLFEKLDIPQRQLMTRMLRENSMRQTQWSCRALLEWECCAKPLTMPIYAIHGAIDEVIPPTGIEPQELVSGGRHLINLTHPDDVNRFIEKSVFSDPSDVASS